MPKSTSKPKKPRKVHQVDVGDVVEFFSPATSYTGHIGEVIHVIDSTMVIVKPRVGPERFRGYHRNRWVVYTSKPRGKRKDTGELISDYTMHITEVLFRKRAYVPKPAKPKVEPRVISTLEQLKTHLESDSTEKVVFVPEAQQ